MRAVGIAVLNVVLILAYVLVCPFRADAQELRIRTGETHTGTVAVCETVADAATLIGLTTKYSVRVAMAWIAEPDNTCDLGAVTFTVGEAELDGMKAKDGTTWMVLGVKINDAPKFIVLPAQIYLRPASL